MKISPILIFEDGNLAIKTKGWPENELFSGHLAFDDDALEWSDGNVRWIKIPKSEFIAIRDFLNEYLPKE
jgi:hypothetical protein